MAGLYELLNFQIRVDFTEGGDMPWPSLPNKVVRSAMARLQAITISGGYQTDIEASHVVPEIKGLEWAQTNAPCLMVWLGDEDVRDEHIGMSEKALDLYIWGMVKDLNDPQQAREKLIEDVKDALYSPNRLEDPDDAGAFICDRLEGLRVERDEGELADVGNAAFRITATYLFPEAIQRA